MKWLWIALLLVVVSGCAGARPVSATLDAEAKVGEPPRARLTITWR